MPRFALPPSFTLPEGTLEGENFEVVVTAKVEDGEIEISEIEGIAIPGYEGSEEQEETGMEETDEEQEEMEEVEGESAGDRFNKRFRGRVTAY